MARGRTWLFILGIAPGCDRATDPAPAPIFAPDLEIVSAGSDPRMLVRYEPPAGTTQSLEVAIAVSLIAGDVGGPMPVVVFDITESVDAVLPSGQRLIHAHIDDVHARESADSQIPAVALEPPLAPLRGLSLAGILSTNGRVAGMHLERASTAPALAPETAQQVSALVASFESTVMPLPDVPVGVGAVWRSSKHLDQNGIRLTVVNTVTLTAAQPTHVEYTLDTDVHGADQSIRQGDVDVAIKDILGTGEGKGSIDLTTLAVSSELTQSLHTAMSATGDEQATPLDMTTQTQVRPRSSVAHGAQGDQGAHKAP